jgi:hypothetical protein
VGVTAEAMVFKAAQLPVTDRAWLALRGETAALVEQVLALGSAPTADLVLPEPLTLEGMRVVSVRRSAHRLGVILELEGGPPPTPEGLVRALAGPWVLDVVLRTGRGPARHWLLPPRWAELEPGDGAPPPGSPAPGPDRAGGGPAKPEDAFPGYQPKATPDTLLDYRPELRSSLEALPPATLEALPRLLVALGNAAEEARAHPGTWVQGNQVLGAKAREWEPSDEELVEAELGRRLESVLAAAEPGERARALAKAGERRTELCYRAVEVSHVDVMGSGRFFYASEPIRRTVRLGATVEPASGP